MSNMDLTMLNHSFGRYGLTLKGKWVANTDYAKPLVRELLIKEKGHGK